METLNLTRKEYDSLLSNYSQWFKKNWDKLIKVWNVNGVQATGDSVIVQMVREMLAKIEAV